MATDSGAQVKSREELRDDAAAAYRNTLPGARVSGPGDHFYDIAEGDSGVMFESQRGLVLLLGELFPQTASEERLALHGRRYIGDFKPATKAAGTATAGGEDAAEWSEGDILVHASGQRYRATADGAISGATGTVSVEAIDGGDAGYLAPGETLLWESPPAGIDASATVATMAGGANKETPDQYLARLLDALKNREAGGTVADFESWALSIPGVGYATAFPARRGLGTCDVAVLDPEGDPVSDEVLAEVQTALDANRPCTSLGSLAVKPTIVDLDTVFVLVLDAIYGFSDVPDASVLAGATTSRIPLASVAGYAAGDYVALPTLGQARKIVAINTGEKYLQVSPAFAAAPSAGDDLIPGCPTYDVLADSVRDAFRNLGPGGVYYPDTGENALRGNIEAISVAQTTPAGPMTPIVTEAVVQAYRPGKIELRGAS